MVNNSKAGVGKQSKRDKESAYQAIRNINSAKPETRSPLKKSMSLSKRGPPALNGNLQHLNKVSRSELPNVTNKKSQHKLKNNKTQDKFLINKDPQMLHEDKLEKI